MLKFGPNWTRFVVFAANFRLKWTNFDVSKGIYGHLITNNPWFFIALTMMILGTLLFIAGFLGEMIIRTTRESKNYHIEETI